MEKLGKLFDLVVISGVVGIVVWFLVHQITFEKQDCSCEKVSFLVK